MNTIDPPKNACMSVEDQQRLTDALDAAECKAPKKIKSECCYATDPDPLVVKLRRLCDDECKRLDALGPLEHGHKLPIAEVIEHLANAIRALEGR